MASVVSNRRGGWEIRESRSTPDGPRSRTLASFRVLSSDVLDHAADRAEAPFDASDVVRRARIAGAEISLDETEALVRKLITELSRGAKIPRGLAAALAGNLEPMELPQLSPEAMSAAEWAGVSLADRGRTLFDLLLLVDALPDSRTGKPLEFPRMFAA